jgi:hypothetical protein
MEEKKWINNKDRCWICRRTREEVVKDSEPDKNLFTDAKDAFEPDGIQLAMYFHYPLCKVCGHILQKMGFGCTEAFIKDNVFKITAE